MKKKKRREGKLIKKRRNGRGGSIFDFIYVNMFENCFCMIYLVGRFFME